jgi:acyl carrier protein
MEDAGQPRTSVGGGFAVHPVLVDAGLQAAALAGALPRGELGTGEANGPDGEQVLVPCSWGGLVLTAGAVGVLRAVLAPAGPGAVSVTIVDAAGTVAARAEEVRFWPVTPGQIGAVPVDVTQNGAVGAVSGGRPAWEQASVVSPPDGGGLADRLAELDADGQRELLLEIICGQAAAVLGHGDSEAIEEERAFRDVGFDSVTAVELRNRLASVTGLRLPATLVFDRPDPAALTSYLAGLLLSRRPAGREIFANIEQWDAMLRSADLDSNERTEIQALLRGLLRTVSAARNEGDGSDDIDEMDSDEKLFMALDQESEFFTKN